MRKILIILYLLLITIVSFGQINISNGFRVNTQLPLDARFYFEDTTFRNDIPLSYRYQGLICYTRLDSTNWQLVGGITDDHWKVLSGSSATSFWEYAPDNSIINNNTNGRVQINSLPLLHATSPKYVVTVDDDSKNILSKYPIAAFSIDTVAVGDTTGWDALCEGLSIVDSTSGILWQKVVVRDTLKVDTSFVGNDTIIKVELGDTVGCRWVSTVDTKWLTNGTSIYYKKGNVGVGLNDPFSTFTTKGSFTAYDTLNGEASVIAEYPGVAYIQTQWRDPVLDTIISENGLYTLSGWGTVLREVNKTYKYELMTGLYGGSGYPNAFIGITAKTPGSTVDTYPALGEVSQPWGKTYLRKLWLQDTPAIVDTTNLNVLVRHNNGTDEIKSLPIHLFGFGNSNADSSWTRNYTGSIPHSHWLYPSSLSDSVGIGTITPTSKLDVNGTIKGQSTNASGVYGISTNGSGVFGSSNNSNGVFGSSSGGYAVYGLSINGVGVYGDALNNGWGGKFEGKTWIDTLVLTKAKFRSGLDTMLFINNDTIYRQLAPTGAGYSAGYRISITSNTINNTSYWKDQDTLNVSDGILKIASKKVTSISNGSNSQSLRWISGAPRWWADSVGSGTTPTDYTFDWNTDKYQPYTSKKGGDPSYPYFYSEAVDPTFINRLNLDGWFYASGGKFIGGNNGTSIVGVSGSAYGADISSTGNIGILAQTNSNSYPAIVAQNSTNQTNTVQELLRLSRGTSGTSSTGIGGKLSYYINSTSGQSIEAANMYCNYTNVTLGSEHTKLGWNLFMHGIETPVMNIDDGGLLNLTTYGSGTHTGTATKSLNVDASGNIIEGTVASGLSDSSWTRNYTGKLPHSHWLYPKSLDDSVAIGLNIPTTRLDVKGSITSSSPNGENYGFYTKNSSGGWISEISADGERLSIRAGTNLQNYSDAAFSNVFTTGYTDSYLQIQNQGKTSNVAKYYPIMIGGSKSPGSGGLYIDQQRKNFEVSLDTITLLNKRVVSTSDSALVFDHNKLRYRILTSGLTYSAGYRMNLSGTTFNNVSYWKDQDTLNVSDGILKIASKKVTAITNGSNGQSLRWISGSPRWWADSLGTPTDYTLDWSTDHYMPYAAKKGADPSYAYLYTGTDSPTYRNRLNVDSKLYATQIQVADTLYNGGILNAYNTGTKFQSYGVYAESNSGIAIYGKGKYGIKGEGAANDIGVWGIGGTGVSGEGNTGVAGSGTAFGVYGVSTGVGGIGGIFLTRTTATNTDETALEVKHTSNSYDGENGIGANIVFDAQGASNAYIHLAKISGIVTHNTFLHGSGSLKFATARDATLTTKFELDSIGRAKLNYYGSGTNTGTATYGLSVDASGNIIETSGGTDHDEQNLSYTNGVINITSGTGVKLPLFSQSDTARGMVPGTAAASPANFLSANGTWTVPTGTTYSAGYRMGLSGTTFNNINYHNTIDSISSSIPYTSTLTKVVVIDTVTGKLYRKSMPTGSSSDSSWTRNYTATLPHSHRLYPSSLDDSVGIGTIPTQARLDVNGSIRGIGVTGIGVSGAFGVAGSSPTGNGVVGSGFTGVNGISTGYGGDGVYGYSSEFTNPNAVGIHGRSFRGWAVLGNGKSYFDTIRMSSLKSIKVSGTADSCVWFDRSDSTLKIKKVGGGTSYWTQDLADAHHILYPTSTDDSIAVGKNTPLYKLDVVGTIKGTGTGVVTGVYGESSSGSGVSGISSSGKGIYGISTSAEGVHGQSTDGQGVSGVSMGVGSGVYGTNIGTGTGVYGSSLNGFQFRFGNDKVLPYDSIMIMSSNGNVGIGITNPTSKLYVFDSSYNKPMIYAINNSVSTTGTHSAIQGVSAKGYGVYGNSTSSVGIYGTSSSMYGVDGYSVSSAGVFGSSLNGLGMSANVYPSSTNSVTEVLAIGRYTTGTATTGIGGSIIYHSESSTGTGYSVGSIGVKLTNVTENKIASTMLFGIKNVTGIETALELDSSGKAKLNKYGTGAITGTPTYGLSVDAGGNIIETSGGAGIAWSDTTATIETKTYNNSKLALKVAKSEIITMGRGGVDSLQMILTGYNKIPIDYSSGFVVDSLIFMGVGASVNVTFTVSFGNSIAATGTPIVTGGTAVTSVTTPTRVGTISNATIAKGNEIWIAPTAVTTKCRRVGIVIKGHRL